MNVLTVSLGRAWFSFNLCQRGQKIQSQQVGLFFGSRAVTFEKPRLARLFGDCFQVCLTVERFEVCIGFPYCLLQGGPLLVISGIITPINGLLIGAP